MDQNLREKWAQFDAWSVSSHLWLVVLVSFLALSAQIWLHGATPTNSGQNTARLLSQHAVGLGNEGVFGPSINEDASAVPGMGQLPLYPAFLASAMSLDENLASGLKCIAWSAKPEGCEAAWGPALLVQALILSLVPFFTWLTAWQLSGRKAMAWGAVILVLLSGRQAATAAMFTPAVLSLPLFAALILSVAVAIQSRFWLWFALVGLSSGLLALNQPHYPWLVYGLFPVLAYWRAAFEQNSRYFWITLALLVGPYLLMTGPWMWRNHDAFGLATLSVGPAAAMLAERLAWNAMSALEVAVSFVYWLGGIGPDFAASAYPAEAWQRLVPDSPEGYDQAASVFVQQSLAAAGGPGQHFSYLSENHLWSDIGKHVAVTSALLWRGIWIAGFWSLPLAPLAIAYAAVSISRRRTDIVMPFSMCIYMLFLQAFATVNQPSQNDILIPMISVLVAMLAGEWIRHKISAA